MEQPMPKIDVRERTDPTDKSEGETPSLSLLICQGPVCPHYHINARMSTPVKKSSVKVYCCKCDRKTNDPNTLWCDECRHEFKGCTKSKSVKSGADTYIYKCGQVPERTTPKAT
jgi:hypothetical protein